MLIDTSVWIDIFRDPSGQRAAQLNTLLQNQDIFLNRFVQLELLQGAADEQDWALLDDYLDTQLMLEANTQTWRTAARLYFDLRRAGITVRSTIDCCIAQIAIEHDKVLLHRDRDFQQIAKLSTLQKQYLDWD